MDIDRLRRTLKRRWLRYYQDNRSWLVRLGIWVSCDGHRRPSSSFILATVSVLEPRLAELFPLIVDLSHNPDHVVDALGLNFDPDEELQALQTIQVAEVTDASSVRMLPGSMAHEVSFSDACPPASIQTRDEACEGITRSDRNPPPPNRPLRRQP